MLPQFVATLLLLHPSSPTLQGDIKGDISCGSPVSYYMADGADPDVFSFFVPWTEDITFSLCNSQDHFNTRMHLYDSAKNQLGATCDALISHSGPGNCAACHQTSFQETWDLTLQSDSYYIEIYGYAGYSGTYQLDMSCTPSPTAPTATSSPTSSPTPAPTKPTSNPTTSVPTHSTTSPTSSPSLEADITCGVNITDSIRYKNDSKLYGFFVPTPSSLPIIFSLCNSPVTFDTEMVLYDSDMQPIGDKCDYYTNPTGPGTCNHCGSGQESWDMDLSPGYYYLEVHGYGTNTGTYRLDMICDLPTTTSIPTSAIPTTSIPTTTEPTTTNPTTSDPTTSIPTTNYPTSDKPTTINPSTMFPTTLYPTSKPSLSTTAFVTGPTIKIISAKPTNGEGIVGENTSKGLESTNNVNMEVSGNDGDMMFMYIIIGCVVFLFCIIIICIICYYRRKMDGLKKEDQDKIIENEKGIELGIVARVNSMSSDENVLHSGTGILNGSSTPMNGEMDSNDNIIDEQDDDILFEGDNNDDIENETMYTMQRMQHLETPGTPGMDIRESIDDRMMNGDDDDEEENIDSMYDGKNRKVTIKEGADGGKGRDFATPKRVDNDNDDDDDGLYGAASKGHKMTKQ